MQLFHNHLQLRLKSFNLLVKEFFKPVNMWQSSRQTGWLCHIPFAIYFWPWRCRTCQISKIWCVIVYYEQKVLLIVVMLIHRLIRVFLSKISNCCRPVSIYWQTDAISDWLTADHVRHFAATSFSLLQQLCTVGHGTFYMAVVSICFSE